MEATDAAWILWFLTSLCGVVWCGVVWCGVVWCGVVWCGVVWYRTLRVKTPTAASDPCETCNQWTQDRSWSKSKNTSE